MAAAVERQRRVLDHLVGGGRARGEEARAEPAQHGVGGGVVGGHDDHAPAAAGADPVLGDRDGLRRAGARGVHLRVGPARADQLGELRVPHRQDAEQEAAVERVRLVLELALHVVDAALDLGEDDGVGAVVVEHARAQRLERVEALSPHVVDRVASDLVGHLLEAREGRGEDHAGVVAQLVGQRPAVRQLRARGRRLVAQHERDAGVVQRVDARGHRELRVAPERLHAVVVDPELLLQVERAGAAGELDDVVEAVDRLEARTALVALDEPRDVLGEHLLAQARRDDVDALLAVQQARDVVVVEDVLGAREPEPGAGDHRRLGRRRTLAAALADQLAAALDELVEQAPELVTRGRGRGRRRGRGRGCRSLRCARRGGGPRAQCGGLHAGRLGAGAQPGGPQAAQRRVERHDAAHLGVVRGEAQDLVVAQHVGGEALQRVLRADLDEHPRALLVERVQALDELHRRGNLPGQDVEHLLLHVVAGRVELAVDVGDDRQPRRLQAEALEGRPQRRARRRHDLRVEGVAHRQQERLVPALLELGHDLADGIGRAAEHDLVGRVDVGEDHVAVARRDDLLDLGQRRHHGGHRAGVADVEAGHLTPAGADRLERGLERERSGSDQRAVLAQRVAHDEVRGDPVLTQQARERDVDGEHRRLRDLGRPQLLLGPGDRGGVRRVGEDDVGQLPALEQRRHDGVGLVEEVGDHRLAPSQVGQHVGVLGALPGVEEGDLPGSRTAAAVDPAPAQCCPGGGVARL